MDAFSLGQVLGEEWQIISSKSGMELPVLGEKVCLFYPEIDSTSDEAARLAPSTFEGKTKVLLLLAQHQTAGHGRMGRPWHAPEGAALTMTLLCREPVLVRPMGHIPLLVGWSVLRALSSYVTWTDLDLKWPNDIFIKGKKVGGVLCSSMTKAGKGWLTLGIGVNVGDMEFPAELCSIATTVVHHSSSSPTIPEVAQAVMECLEEDLEKLSPNDLLKNFQGQSSICFGQQISFEEQGREGVGITCGLDRDGALRCRSEAGDVRSLHVSEVQRVKRV